MDQVEYGLGQLALIAVPGWFETAVEVSLTGNVAVRQKWFTQGSIRTCDKNTEICCRYDFLAEQRVNGLEA